MKPRTVHVLRVLMFASILLCIHWQHREYLQRQVRVEDWSDVLPVIQDVLPEADVVVDSSTTEANVETAAEVRVPMVRRLLEFYDRRLSLIIFWASRDRRMFC